MEQVLSAHPAARGVDIDQAQPCRLGGGDTGKTPTWEVRAEGSQPHSPGGRAGRHAQEQPCWGGTREETGQGGWGRVFRWMDQSEQRRQESLVCPRSRQGGDGGLTGAISGASLPTAG